MVTGRHSDCLDIKRRDPDVDLLEAGFQPLLQLHENLPIALTGSDVDEHLNKLIAVDSSTVFPLAFDYLQLVRHGAEALTQFMYQFAVQFLWNRRSVVKPPREINLVSA